jgi:hypothetical protein
MTPSSTVMLRPQPTPQKPQIVLASLVSTAISAAVTNSLTPLHPMFVPISVRIAERCRYRYKTLLLLSLAFYYSRP